jgi:hypothetical protein
MNPLKKKLLTQMKKQKISRAELARRLNCTQGNITIFFNTEGANYTSVLRVAKAIGCKITFQVEPVGVGIQAAPKHS